MIELLISLFKVVGVVVEAIKTGDETKADQILPLDLRTSITKAAKEVEAFEKFGPRDP